MVRIGPDGRVTMGYTAVSVDGIVPAPLVGRACFFPSWFNDDELVYQDGNVGGAGPWQIHKLNLTTLVTNIESPLGANVVDAGNNMWAAWLGTDGAVRTSSPTLGPYPGAWLAHVAEDGRLVLLDSYQAGGGITVYRPDGTVAYARPDLIVAFNNIVRLTGNLLSYLEANGRWHIIDITSGQEVNWVPRLDGVNWMRPAIYQGRLFVVERTEKLTLREATRPDAWVLRESPDTYYPDIKTTGGKIRVACCQVIGEHPNSLMVFDVTPNMSTGTVEMAFGTTTGGPLTFAPPVVIGAVTVSVGDTTEAGLVTPIDLPYTHPFISKDGEAAEKGIISREWQIALQRLEASVQNLARSVSVMPAPIPPPAGSGGGGGTGSSGGFTQVSSPGQPDIIAAPGSQTLVVRSDDASIEVKLIPGPQIVNLRAVGGGGGGGEPLTNGNKDWAELIFADGDVIMVDPPTGP